MGSEPTRNAAVELIMVVVDTMADTFAGTTEAEVDSVLVSLKDPLSDTCCGAQPENRNPQTSLLILRHNGIPVTHGEGLSVFCTD